MHLSIATAEDIPALADLLAILFCQEAEFTPNPPLQIAALNKIIANPTLGEIIIARINDEAVGMVNLLYTCSTALGGTVGLLEDMVIKPGWRRQNLGTHLLEYAIDRARSRGCLRITLLTDSNNTEAQRFYHRQGFTASTMLPMRLIL
ncbi:MAG TPA: GNAT family N-acetyltransferase [Cellvibrionaceae bacterium]|nr:GNAT family N-acetyltransferase [Cellvibrionaceae bacterium]HMW72639.1 GNAT family N-acetyltransferase [Cellvibrionaceae bacterium]HNG61758.1 GNAT family N-acetyltransferase [Cellvibrionaceae bacterium]